MECVNRVQGKTESTWPPRRAVRRSTHPRVHFPPFEVRRKAVQWYVGGTLPPRSVQVASALRWTTRP
jgi:hypothetical protein